MTLMVQIGDTDTTDAKYGAKPMTWSGPNGCIDVNMWATS